MPTKYAKSPKRDKKSFYSDSNQKQNGTSRYRRVEKAEGKPPKPPAAEHFEFRMSHAPCIPSSEPHWTWTTWTTVKTTKQI